MLCRILLVSPRAIIHVRSLSLTNKTSSFIIDFDSVPSLWNKSSSTHVSVVLFGHFNTQYREASDIFDNVNFIRSNPS